MERDELFAQIEQLIKAFREAAQMEMEDVKARKESQARQASRPAQTPAGPTRRLKAYTYRLGDEVIETKAFLPDPETDA